jgi:hypothetical protein
VSHAGAYRRDSLCVSIDFPLTLTSLLRAPQHRAPADFSRMTAPTLPPLQPRSPTEVVDAAVQLIRGHFAYFLTLAAIGAVPLLVVSIAQAIVAPLPNAFNPTATTPIDPNFLWKYLPFQLLLMVFYTVQSAAVLVAGFQALRAAPLPGPVDAFRSAVTRTGHIMLVYVLAGVLGMLATLPVIIALALLAGTGAALAPSWASPGTLGTVIGVLLAVLMMCAFVALVIFVLALITLANTLVVVERLGAWRALRRAWALMRGSRWRQVGVWGITYLVMTIATVALFAVAAATGNQQVMAALNVLALIPITPFVGGVMLTSYADLRARREGADLDAELSALGVPA